MISVEQITGGIRLTQWADRPMGHVQKLYQTLEGTGSGCALRNKDMNLENVWVEVKSKRMGPHFEL